MIHTSHSNVQSSIIGEVSYYQSQGALLKQGEYEYLKSGDVIVDTNDEYPQCAMFHSSSTVVPLAESVVDIRFTGFSESSTRIAVASSSIYKSTDDGATWNIVLSGAEARQSLPATDDKGTWIVLRTSGEFYRSVDDGATWSIIPKPSFVGTTEMNIVVYLGNDTFICVGGATASNTHRIARSTDGGVTWSQIDSSRINTYPIPVGENSKIATDKRGRCAITAGKYIAYTTDYGLTWVIRHTNSSVDYNFSIATNSEGVWVTMAYSSNTNGYHEYIYYSTDDMATWNNTYRAGGLRTGVVYDSIRKEFLFGGYQSSTTSDTVLDCRRVDELHMSTLMHTIRRVVLNVNVGSTGYYMTADNKGSIYIGNYVRRPKTFGLAKLDENNGVCAYMRIK